MRGEIHLIARVALVVLTTLLMGASATQEGKSAEIAGTLKTSRAVTRIVAIDRGLADVLKTSKAACKDKFVYEGTFDAKTGAFRVPRVLAGRAYDLVVWTKGAGGEEVRWEGCCMDYHREIVPAKEGVTEEDRKWLEGFVKEMPAFFDKARVVHMAADHQHATLLVELARTRDFHSEKKGGEIIYRVELWYFENLFGGWAKDKNTEKVLVRWRGKPGEIEKNWQFLPGLGGIVAGDKPVTIMLPEHVSEGNGLSGGIKPSNR
jgi:hypothetical protein